MALLLSSPPLSQTAPMAPPKLATLLLFLLCLSQSSARDHPLDPLTPSEISTIRSIIKSSHLVGSSKSLAFHYVGLDEPDKPDVLAWQSGRRAALPRRAFVIARADRRTHELYIDISNSSITSDKIYDGFGYPAFTFEETETASALPFNHTSFLESVRKRGLELKDVVCLAFTVGWYGEERQERRLASLMCFVTGETTNLYMRPLEGVKMLVDLDAMEIVEYKDRKVVPVPKAAGTDYRASKQEPPFGPQTKPGVVVQPEGKGFKIDGHVVRLISDLLPPPLSLSETWSSSSPNSNTGCGSAGQDKIGSVHFQFPSLFGLYCSSSLSRVLKHPLPPLQTVS